MEAVEDVPTVFEDFLAQTLRDFTTRLDVLKRRVYERNGDADKTETMLMCLQAITERLNKLEAKVEPKAH